MRRASTPRKSHDQAQDQGLATNKPPGSALRRRLLRPITQIVSSQPSPGHGKLQSSLLPVENPMGYLTQLATYLPRGQIIHLDEIPTRTAPRSRCSSGRIRPRRTISSPRRTRSCAISRAARPRSPARRKNLHPNLHRNLHLAATSRTLRAHVANGERKVKKCLQSQ